MARHDRGRQRHAAKPAFARRSAASLAAAGRQKLTATAGNEQRFERSTMRRSQRLIAVCVLSAFSGVLGGCSSGGFDPTDLLDFLDTKKKLPGDRKPVFPDGVPGLEQGVPREMYKGAQQQQENAQAAAAARPAPAEPPKSKQASKSKKGKPVAAAASTAAAPDAEAAPEEDTTAAAPPPPKPSKLARKRTTAPPPDPDAPPPGGQSTQQSQGGFPAPLPSGTFTR